MFNQIVEQLKLRFMLARQLRLEFKLARTKEQLNLRERFGHGRYRVGEFEILRSDASGGYDTTKFLKDHPEVAKQLRVAKYAKPRVERVRVQLAPRQAQKTS